MRDVRLLGLVFEMVGKGKRIEPIAVGFLDPDGGPHMAVGKDRMGMQVNGQDHTAVSGIGKPHGALEAVIVIGAVRWPPTVGRGRVHHAVFSRCLEQ